MIHTAETLALYIRDALATEPHCRIYQDVLDYCWPPAGASGRPQQAQEIEAFALRQRWIVKLHTPGAYGLVADFSRNPLPG